MESTAKGYQREVLRNALDIFRWTESQLQSAHDDASRRAASSHNGCILLEAPTGAGKTRMAGMLAEEFSNTAAHQNNARIVWFWFTPFAGLVEQASLSLRETFQGLRIRSLADDRVVRGTRSGDLYVTTWAAVAASNQETRRIRTSGDTSLSFDEFLERLRSEGFRIGVVIDEAHHGFFTAPLAFELYRDVMRPDFTLLITATPDDRDVELFKKGAGISELHRLRVSRKDAVDAGLIKEGIKSIAYLAPEDQKALVDFHLTALADGWRTHTAISHELSEQGIDLVPLMLVQVSNSDSAVSDARERLIKLGVPEDAIASYTSLEPKDDLLTVALDETKQVLIFKIAVALGFDAPRAFTLVSLRGSKDTSFGIQVVGRILRVHPRLQGRMLAGTLPRLLRFGYVFLSDAENQQGLSSAGEKINGIKTELSQICPYTMVVNIAGRSEVQVLENGQSSLLPPTWRPVATPRSESDDGVLILQPQPSAQPRQTDFLEEFLLEPPQAQPAQVAKPALDSANKVEADKRHALRPGVEQAYQTERMPLSTDALVQCIAACIDFSADVLAAGRRENVRLVRREIEVMAGEEVNDDTIHGRLSDDEIARRAQGSLFEAEHLDPRQLYAALLARLATEYDHRGWETKPGELEKALSLILVTFPSLLRKAERKCSAEHKEVVLAAPLPEYVNAIPGMVASKRNIYGVMPLDLNQDERELAMLLDSDTSETVEWWWRNEVRKPWSIALVLPTGDRYFPDFVVKVRDRSKGNGILLIECKGRHILNGDDTLEKVVAEHKIYKRPIMVTRADTGTFRVVEHDAKLVRNEPGQAFRIENLAGY